MSYECYCNLHLTQPVGSVSLMCVLTMCTCAAGVKQLVVSVCCLSVVCPVKKIEVLWFTGSTSNSNIGTQNIFICVPDSDQSTSILCISSSSY